MPARTHIPTVFGVLTAAVVAFAAGNPANADTRISFSALTPLTPVNAIDAAPSSACSDPDSAARVTQPYTSPGLKLAALPSGQTAVKVVIDLDSMGTLLQARIAKPSGDSSLDQQALTAARGSKYAPEVHNCTSFKRSYYLDITFDAQTAVLPK